MKIIIFGAAGYVGSHLVERLSLTNQVIAADIFQPKNQFKGVEYLCSPEDVSSKDLEEILSHSKSEIIINLAQYPDYRDFPNNTEMMFATNVTLPLRLLEAARRTGIKSFILFSSGGIYGEGKKIFHELDRLNPLDFYLSTKSMAELIARRYREFMHVHIVRPFFIYGPNQEDKLIVNLAERIANQLPVFLNGNEDGGKLNPIYIQDVIDLTEKILDISGSSTLNFAGPDVVSMEEIIHLIAEILQVEPIIERREDADPIEMIGDISRIYECFPEYKLTPLKVGLKLLSENLNRR